MATLFRVGAKLYLFWSAIVRYMDCFLMKQWMLFMSCLYLIQEKGFFSVKDSCPTSCLVPRDVRVLCVCKMKVFEDAQGNYEVGTGKLCGYLCVLLHVVCV